MFKNRDQHPGKGEGPQVLVTDASYTHSLAAARSLAKAGFIVQVVGHPLGQARFSSAVSGFSPQKRRGKDNFRQDLRELVATGKTDVILPIGASSVFAVNRDREWMQERVAFALAPHESLAVARSKADLLGFARDIGIHVPQTWHFRSYDSLVEQIPDLPLPFVLKSNSEEQAYGPVYVNSEEDLIIALQSPQLLSHFVLGEVIAQPLIRGRGEGFFSLHQYGVCKRMMMHRRLREMPATGGSSWAAQSISSSDLRSEGLALLDALEWHGPAMVEFKRETESGKLVLMELNPKFWGSLDLSIACGVDFPSDTARVALGERLEADYTFEVGKNFVWPLSNLRSFATDRELRRLEFTTNVKLKDPLPTVMTLIVSALVGVKSLVVKSGIARQLAWMRRYTLSEYTSRFVGEILGIPLRIHCEVDEFMWIGARPRVLGRILLRVRGRQAVSLLAITDAEHAREGSLLLPLDEFVGFSGEKLGNYCQVLGQMKELGSKVFVHCREGVGRAPSLAIAFLMTEGLTYDEAKRLVDTARPVCSVNRLQSQSLKEFEQRINGRQVI